MVEAPPIAEDETARLAELDKLELMYTQPEEVFDRITAQLADIFGASAAMMNLMDSENQYAKSTAGIPAEMLGDRVIPRCKSMCGFVVAHNEPLVVEDLALDPRFRDIPSVKEKGLRFYAGTPLRAENGQPIGSLCVVDTVPHQVSPRERKLLRLVAETVMLEVKLRATSRELLERNREMHRDLAAARSVQRFLLPPQRQNGKGFTIWHYYHPVDVIGGDFLDAHIRPDGSLAAVVADVSGHGASAALSSAMVKTVFQTAAASAAGPEDLLSSLQQGLGPAIANGQFITAAAAVYDPHQRLAQLASAGHPYPILLREGNAELIETVHDLPLLIEPDQMYSRRTPLEMRKGDRLLWYTDGAIEAADPGGKMLDAAGLMEMLRAEAMLAAESLLPSLFRKIRSFAQGRLHDDIALVCLEIE